MNQPTSEESRVPFALRVSRARRTASAERSGRKRAESKPLWGTEWQVGAYTLVSLCLLLLALPQYTFIHRFLASVLIVAGTLPLVQHIRYRRKGVPLMEIPLATYPIFFALPLFYQSQQMVCSGLLVPLEEPMTKTLLAVIIAVVSLLAGYRLAASPRMRSILPRFRIQVAPLAMACFALVLICGNLVVYSIGKAIPEEWLRPLFVLFSADLGMAILGILYQQKRLNYGFRLGTMFLVFALTVRGLASGMTQDALQPIFLFAVTGWVVNGRAPLVMGTCVVAVIFLLQPIKNEYRSRTWFGNEGAFSTKEKIGLYVTIASDYWLGSGGKGSKVSESIKESANQRMSLLLSSQQYVDLTPREIPYKKGESIAYLFYGWIPRAVWANKPIAQAANKEYPVEYGLQHPFTVSSSSFGVGHVAEGYVNFGILGLPPLFLLLGMLTYFPKAVLDLRGGNAAALSLQCAACMKLMFVGSSVGNVYGGLISELLMQAFLLYLLGKFAPAVD